MKELLRQWTLRAFVAAALLAPAGGAGAEPPGPGGRRHGPPPIDRVLDRHAEELGLDDAVREQVGAIAARSRETEEPLRAALRAARDELHALLRQDAPDADAVMRQADAVGAAETALHKQRLRTLLEVRALLTPEQRAKLGEIFEKKRERMKKWRHGEDEPPPPPD
jgi:Spy/CpxP family protein refolding chaperone